MKKRTAARSVENEVGSLSFESVCPIIHIIPALSLIVSSMQLGFVSLVSKDTLLFGHFLVDILYIIPRVVQCSPHSELA